MLACRAPLVPHGEPVLGLQGTARGDVRKVLAGEQVAHDVSRLFLGRNVVQPEKETFAEQRVVLLWRHGFASARLPDHAHPLSPSFFGHGDAPLARRVRLGPDAVELAGLERTVCTVAGRFGAGRHPGPETATLF